MPSESQSLNPTVAVESRNGATVAVITPSNDETEYVCVRKSGDMPSSVLDGDIVFKGKGPSTDGSLCGGKTYFYMLACENGEKEFVGPVEVFPPVSSVDISLSMDFISLMVMIPDGATSVEVYRAVDNGTPSLLGTRSGSGLANIVDNEISQGSAYSYSFRVIYPHGKSQYFTKTQAMHKYPAPIDVDIRKEGDRYFVKNLDNPKFKLYYSEKDLTEYGSLCVADNIMKIVGELDLDEADGGWSGMRIPENFNGYIYPICTMEGMCVVGNPGVVSSMQEVSDLRVTVQGKECAMTFSLPEEAVGIKYIYGRKSMPKDHDDPDAVGSMFVSRTEIMNRRFRVSFPVPFDRAYLKVYTVYPDNVYSNGVEKMIVINRTEVRYSYKKSTIQFVTNPPTDYIPPMIAVDGGFRKPRTASSGMVIENIPGVELKNGKGSVATSISKDTFEHTGLFFEDKNDAVSISLLPQN